MQKHLEIVKKSTRHLLSRLKTYEKIATENSWTVNNQPLDLLDCLRALAATGNTIVIPVLKRYLNRDPQLKPVLKFIENHGKTFIGLERSLRSGLEEGIKFAEEGYPYMERRLLDPKISEEKKQDLLYLLWLNKEYPKERMELLKKLLNMQNLSDEIIHDAVSALPIWKKEVKKLSPEQLTEYIELYKELLYTHKDPRVRERMISNFEVLNRTGTLPASAVLEIIEKTPNPHENDSLFHVYKAIIRRMKLRAILEIKRKNKNKL